jgi:hypothetical protein
VRETGSLGCRGVTITTAPDDWSYAMHFAFAKSSGTVAPSETIVIQIVLRVERGVIEIAGVDEGTSGFTTATHVLASDPFPKTLTVRIDDKERTRGLIMRNASGNLPCAVHGLRFMCIRTGR